MADFSKIAAAFEKRKLEIKETLNIPDSAVVPEYDPLVDKYPEQIHHRLFNHGMQLGAQVGKGWYDLITELDDAIKLIYPLYTIQQVKEKFGELRFYISDIPSIIPESQRNQIKELISTAESRSICMCDVCGATGKPQMVNKYLLATRCKKHDKEETTI